MCMFNCNAFFIFYFKIFTYIVIIIVLFLSVCIHNSAFLAAMVAFLIIIIIIIIWGANHPYSQLCKRWIAKDAATMCSRSRYARGPLAANHINPLWPRSTAKIKSVWFFPREENRMVWKTLVAQQRTNAQLNSHNGPGRESKQGSPWWEASTLRTSQPCHPLLINQ